MTESRNDSAPRPSDQGAAFSPIRVPVFAAKFGFGVPFSRKGHAACGTTHETPVARQLELAKARGGCRYDDWQTALERRYDTDAHFAAYSAEGAPVRLSKGAFAIAFSNGNPVRMVLAVLDVDAPTNPATGKKDATPEWRKATRRRIVRFVNDNPGFATYETGGGFRLVAPRAGQGVPIDGSWAERYEAECAYIKTQWGIECDTSCKDPGRVFRLPRVVRDGVATITRITLPCGTGVTADPGRWERVETWDPPVKVDTKPLAAPVLRAAQDEAANARELLARTDIGRAYMFAVDAQVPGLEIYEADPGVPCVFVRSPFADGYSSDEGDTHFQIIGDSGAGGVSSFHASDPKDVRAYFTWLREKCPGLVEAEAYFDKLHPQGLGKARSGGLVAPGVTADITDEMLKSAAGRAKRSNVGAAAEGLFNNLLQHKPIEVTDLPVLAEALRHYVKGLSAESYVAAVTHRAVQHATDAGAFQAAVAAAFAPAPVAPTAATDPSDPRPAIELSAPLEDVNRLAVAALLKLDTVFERSSILSEVRGTNADIVALNKAPVVRDRLARAATFWDWSEKKGRYRTDPSPDVAAYVASASHLGGRELDAMLNVPCVRDDGTVHAVVGYDPATRFYLRRAFDAVPMTADQAVATLTDALGDFAYDGPKGVGLAVAVAAVLTLVQRPALWRNAVAVPGFAIDAGDGGRGKSLLTDIITMIGTGDVVSGVAWVDDENELMKRVDSKLFAGQPVLKFENVRTGGTFGTPALDGYMTSTRFVESRTLQTSNVTRVPWVATVLINGNNLAFAGEAARRFLHVRLGEKEGGFKRSETELKMWVSANVHRLQSAALVLLSAHVRATDAPGVLPYPSFEAWAVVIAGCVKQFFGVDPVTSQVSAATMSEGSEAIENALADLAKVWTAPKTTAELAAEGNGNGLGGPLTAKLIGLVNAVCPHYREVRLAVHLPKVLSRIKDKRCGAYTVTHHADLGDRKKGRGWSIEVAPVNAAADPTTGT